VSVEVEKGPTVAGTVAAGPCRMLGDMVATRLTVMLNPLLPVTVTEKVVEEPRKTDLEDGLAVIAKSGRAPDEVNVAP
jgi:hypothetical protein